MKILLVVDRARNKQNWPIIFTVEEISQVYLIFKIGDARAVCVRDCKIPRGCETNNSS